MNKRLKKILIGHVAVDTGTIIILDPVNQDCCSAALDVELDKPGTYQDIVNEQDVPVAVVTDTGYGDGLYPVYAHRDEEGRTLQVTIDFRLKG